MFFFTSGFAGGGSRQFNHFHAELTARSDLFAAAGNCVAKKRCLLFRMPHGFDFATQNLSGSVRSIPAPSYLTEGGLVKIRKLLDGANVPVDLDLSQATGLTYIATDTFIECFTMQSVKLPSSVTEIGKYAFEGCTSLTQAPELPAETLTASCYTTMFSGCEKLSSVTMLAKTNVNAYSALYHWLDGTKEGCTLYVASGMEANGTIEGSLRTGWTVEVAATN